MKNINISNIKNWCKKNKNIIFIIIIAINMLIIINFIRIGISKYIEKINNTGTSKVAKMICEMELNPSEADSETINPYCIVTVKNYNADGKITETAVEYKITVLPKGNFQMPEYYWQDSEGKIIAKSTYITDRFSIDAQEEKVYKLVFVNPGDEDVTKNFKIITTTTQV